LQKGKHIIAIAFSFFFWCDVHAELTLGEITVRSYKGDPFFAVIPINPDIVDDHSTIQGGVAGYHEEIDNLKYNFVATTQGVFLEIFGPAPSETISFNVHVSYKDDIASKTYTVDPSSFREKRGEYISNVYVVEEGDTLGEIVGKFKHSLGGSHHYRLNRFRLINNLSPNQVLHVGDVLIVPQGFVEYDHY